MKTNLDGPAIPINGTVPADGQFRAAGDDGAVQQWSEWAGFWDLHHYEADRAAAEKFVADNPPIVASW